MHLFVFKVYGLEKEEKERENPPPPPPPKKNQDPSETRGFVGNTPPAKETRHGGKGWLSVMQLSGSDSPRGIGGAGAANFNIDLEDSDSNLS